MLCVEGGGNAVSSQCWRALFIKQAESGSLSLSEIEVHKRLWVELFIETETVREKTCDLSMLDRILLSDCDRISWWSLCTVNLSVNRYFAGHLERRWCKVRTVWCTVTLREPMEERRMRVVCLSESEGSLRLPLPSCRTNYKVIDSRLISGASGGFN